MRPASPSAWSRSSMVGSAWAMRLAEYTLWVTASCSSRARCSRTRLAVFWFSSSRRRAWTMAAATVLAADCTNPTSRSLKGAAPARRTTARAPMVFACRISGTASRWSTARVLRLLQQGAREQIPGARSLMTTGTPASASSARASKHPSPFSEREVVGSALARLRPMETTSCVSPSSSKVTTAAARASQSLRDLLGRGHERLVQVAGPRHRLGDAPQRVQLHHARLQGLAGDRRRFLGPSASR